MKVSEIAKQVKDNKFPSLYRFEHSINVEKPLCRLINGFTLDDNQIVTKVYKCEDGLIGVTGIDLEADYLPEHEFICTAEEYLKVTRQVTDFQPVQS